MKFLRRSLKRIAQFFSRQSFRAPLPMHEPSLGSNLKPEKGITRQEKMIEWCKAFNKRNGNIVSNKSPESIYRKTHRRDTK